MKNTILSILCGLSLVSCTTLPKQEVITPNGMSAIATDLAIMATYNTIVKHPETVTGFDSTRKTLIALSEKPIVSVDEIKNSVNDAVLSDTQLTAKQRINLNLALDIIYTSLGETYKNQAIDLTTYSALLKQLADGINRGISLAQTAE